VVSACMRGKGAVLSADLLRNGLRNGAEARSKSSRGLRCAPPASPPRLTTVGGGGGAVLGACGGGGLPNGLPQGLPNMGLPNMGRDGLPQGLPWAETGLEAPNMAFPTMGLPNMGYAPGDMAHVRAGRTGLEPVLQLLPA
jgi:hypothetical protein